MSPRFPTPVPKTLEATRIPSAQTAFAVGAEQIGRWAKLLADRLLVIGDRAYPNAPFLQALAKVEADLLLRVRKDRGWYRPASSPCQPPSHTLMSSAKKAKWHIRCVAERTYSGSDLR